MAHFLCPCTYESMEPQLCLPWPVLGISWKNRNLVLGPAHNSLASRRSLEEEGSLSTIPDQWIRVAASGARAREDGGILEAWPQLCSAP